MSDDVGVIPEFFFTNGKEPLLTKEFFSNVPDNSRIVIYKGRLRNECYIVVEDGNTRRQRAFSKQHTFNECIEELEIADMSLSVVKRVERVETLKTEKNKISDKQVNDIIRKLWAQMEKDKK